MKFKNLFFGAMIATLAIPALANKPISVGSGGVGGSYYPMVNDMIAFCGSSTSRQFTNIESPGGSVGNVIGMTNKEFHAGITQIDVLKYYAKMMGEKVNANRMKVVVGLHRESGHLMIPPGWEPKSSGFSGFFSKLNFLEDKKGVDINLLKNQTIGAWGGSIVSAKALSSFLGLNMNVVEIQPGAKVDSPVLRVAGQPDDHVKAYLAAGWNIVPIDAEILKNRASFYDKVTLNYSIGGKVVSIPSFGVRAVFVAKSSRADARNLPFSEMASCLRKSLADLADDSDTNPNWESVYEFENEEQVDWDYFPLLK